MTYERTDADDVNIGNGFVSLLCKTNTLHVAVRLFSKIDHRRRQNVVRTLMTHSPAAYVPLFCLYHKFDDLNF